MNTSEKTAIIAEGIAAYAKVQDGQGTEALLRWDKWKERYPQFADFVKKEQFDLFDRVNATL